MPRGAEREPRPTVDQSASLPNGIKAAFGALSFCSVVLSVLVAPPWLAGGAIGAVGATAALHRHAWRMPPTLWVWFPIGAVAVLGALAGEAIKPHNAPSQRPLRSLPLAASNFATQAQRNTKAARGKLIGFGADPALPDAARLTLECNRGCSRRTYTLLERPRFISFRPAIHITGATRLTVTVQLRGYLTRSMTLRFLRRRIDNQDMGLMAFRVHEGCRDRGVPTPCTATVEQ